MVYFSINYFRKKNYFAKNSSRTCTIVFEFGVPPQFGLPPPLREREPTPPILPPSM